MRDVRGVQECSIRAFVALYLVVTVAIGLWAAKRVHNSKDYVVAGRSVPLFMSMALVFATWFGAETVLGVSATFLNDGLGGIVAARVRQGAERWVTTGEITGVPEGAPISIPYTGFQHFSGPRQECAGVCPQCSSVAFSRPGSRPDFAKVEAYPRLDGRNMTMVLGPDKQAQAKKAREECRAKK